MANKNSKAGGPTLPAGQEPLPPYGTKKDEDIPKPKKVIYRTRNTAEVKEDKQAASNKAAKPPAKAGGAKKASVKVDEAPAEKPLTPPAALEPAPLKAPATKKSVGKVASAKGLEEPAAAVAAAPSAKARQRVVHPKPAKGGKLVPAAVALGSGENVAQAATAAVSLKDRAASHQALSLFSAIGNALYALGFSAEYVVVKTARVLRDFFSLLAQLLLWAGGLLFNSVRGFLGGILEEVTSPFVRYRKRRQQLQRIVKESDGKTGETARRKLRDIKIKNLVQISAHVGMLLMPFLAAAIFAFTVYSLLSMEYALAVEMNGQVLGYVSDQRVVEDAKELLRGRIQLAHGQAVTDWKLTPRYAISRADGFTTTQQLANQILLNSENPNDLVQATGLYVDGELYAVTDRGEELKAYIDNLLQTHMEAAPEGATVQFVRTIDCAVNAEDVFFASSVEKLDDLIEKLEQNVTEDNMAVANGEETLADIAVANGLTAELILQRNPQLAEAAEAEGLGEEYVPLAGKSVLLRRAQPFLQVETVIRMQSVEAVPFETLEIETDDRALGTRAVVQEGVDGAQEVWDDYVYIDGELVRRDRVPDATVSLSQPQARIIEVGTYDFAYYNPGDDTAAYMFPVPTSTWSSRGISAYHRGVDINGPVGEPIFACQSGVVIAAGWHYSYGYHVVIDHGNGMVTLYAHCSSLAVQQGQQVVLGQYIAALGSTGNSSGPHLHLEFQLNGRLVDPMNYITPPPGYRMGWR